MNALLLAAGLGTRLQPLTKTTPKCLIRINGKPLLDYWIELLFAGGCKKILINTHYLHEEVEKHIEHSPWKNDVALSYEEKLLGTAGTLLKNHHFLRADATLIAHADNLAFFDLKAFKDAHNCRPKNCVMTMMLFHTDTPKSCGIVRLNAEGVVVEFFEKTNDPPSDLANAAIYLVDPSFVALLKSWSFQPTDLSTEVIPRLLGRIYTFQNPLYVRDIGTKESLEKAEVEIKRMSATKAP